MENKNGNEKFQQKKEAQKEVGFEFKGCAKSSGTGQSSPPSESGYYFEIGYAYFRML